jgi:hypothetical protein
MRQYINITIIHYIINKIKLLINGKLNSLYPIAHYRHEVLD